VAAASTSETAKPIASAFWSRNSGAGTSFPEFAVQNSGNDVPAPEFLQEPFDPAWLKPIRIGLSPRRVRALVVGDDLLDGMPGHDFLHQLAHRLNLELRKRIEPVIQIHQFDTDGKIVDPRSAILHSRLSGVPCALIFRNMRNDRAITVDRVVRRDFGVRILEVCDDFVERIQDRRMENYRVDCDACRPIVEVRRRHGISIAEGA
jgi:hypothetical protein